MDTPPQQREDQRVRSAAERRQQELLDIVTHTVSARPDLGERLLPYLIAAMEACWVDAVLIALASVNFFERRTTLLPLWAPFVVIASACWLMIFLERRELVKGRTPEDKKKRVSGSSWFILLMVLLVLIVVWASIYATSFFLFDPRWLLALFNDLFQLDGNIYTLFMLVALSIYFCWRGIRLAHRAIEPGSVFSMLRVGMGIIIVAIIVHAASGAGSFNEFILFGIVPCFLFFALVAHALAKAIFLRGIAPGGLQGSVAGQERAILTMMSIIGLIILLLALGIGIFVNPAFLANVQQGLEPLGRFYDWLVTIIAYGITFLSYPIFWLLSLLHVKISLPHKPTLPKSRLGARPSTQRADPMITTLLPVLKIVLPILFIVLMIYLILRLLKRRRIRLVRTEQQDISESIWSWHLFLTQVKEFLLAIWLRFFPHHSDEHETSQEEEIGGEATGQSIRALYRALLHWAAGRGYGRKREETPYEFKARLQEQIPQGEPELSNLTRAYSELRYGAGVPDEAEVARAQTDWATLQRKFLPL